MLRFEEIYIAWRFDFPKKKKDKTNWCKWSKKILKKIRMKLKEYKKLKKIAFKSWKNILNKKC